MYDIDAETYDLLHTNAKDYAGEAAKVADAIRAAHPAAASVLDVACGTGEHARHLTQAHGYRVDGVDLNPSFVRLAHAKLSPGSAFEADMETLALPSRYDVVLCLFSSIAYMRTLPRVTTALSRFREHLAPGGVIIVEPWFAPGVLQHGRSTLTTIEDEGLKACRMSCLALEGDLTRLTFHYLIARAGTVQHVEEMHELGLFTPEQMLEAFRAAGLLATYDPVGLNGRGLYVARAH